MTNGVHLLGVKSLAIEVNEVAQIAILREAMLEITVKDGLSLPNQIALSVLFTIFYLVERIQQHATHEAQLNLTYRCTVVNVQRHA